jgi:hypothetical protein
VGIGRSRLKPGENPNHNLTMNQTWLTGNQNIAYWDNISHKMQVESGSATPTR